MQFIDYIDKCFPRIIIGHFCHAIQMILEQMFYFYWDRYYEEKNENGRKTKTTKPSKVTFGQFQTWQHCFESIACVFVYSIECLLLWAAVSIGTIFIHSFIYSVFIKFYDSQRSYTHDRTEDIRIRTLQHKNTMPGNECCFDLKEFRNSNPNEREHWSK